MTKAHLVIALLPLAACRPNEPIEHDVLIGGGSVGVVRLEGA